MVIIFIPMIPIFFVLINPLLGLLELFIYFLFIQIIFIKSFNLLLFGASYDFFSFCIFVSHFFILISFNSNQPYHNNTTIAKLCQEHKPQKQDFLALTFGMLLFNIMQAGEINTLLLH